jgi:hypothetical protein
MGAIDDTLAVVRAYHSAWTTKNFQDAVRLLAPDLQVEVPINHYPTTESFAQALAGFGGLVTRVELLSEIADSGQAMLLYDLHAERLGGLDTVVFGSGDPQPGAQRSRSSRAGPGHARHRDPRRLVRQLIRASPTIRRRRPPTGAGADCAF